MPINRTALPQTRRATRGCKPPGIVFSLEDGEVWASWDRQDASVRLGTEEEVCLMMKDFLAQVALGKMLTHKQ